MQPVPLAQKPAGPANPYFAPVNVHLDGAGVGDDFDVDPLAPGADLPTVVTKVNEIIAALGG